LICRGLHGGVVLKVLLELFQKLVGAAAIGGRLRRGETPFCGISFLPSFFLWAFGVKEKSGRTVTIGKPGFIFLRKPFRAQYPLFFCYRWRKRKAWQKKTPWFVSPSAEGDQRSARWISAAF